MSFRVNTRKGNPFARSWEEIILYILSFLMNRCEQGVRSVGKERNQPACELRGQSRYSLDHPPDTKLSTLLFLSVSQDDDWPAFTVKLQR